MNLRDFLQWLRHKPGGPRLFDGGWRDTRAAIWRMRFATAALLVLSPVALLPAFMAMGIADPSAALGLILVANVALMVLGLRWLVGVWARRDWVAAAAGVDGQRAVKANPRARATCTGRWQQ